MLWSSSVCVGWTHLGGESGADNCHNIKLNSSFPQPGTMCSVPPQIRCSSFLLSAQAMVCFPSDVLPQTHLPGPGIAHGWTTQTLQMGWDSKDRMASSFGSLVGISIDGLFLALFFKSCPSILQQALPVPCLAHSNQLQCLYLPLHFLQWIFPNQLCWWSPLQMVCERPNDLAHN